MRRQASRFLLLFSAVFAANTSAHALSDHPVISEIVVDTSGLESAGEFVELYNPTGETVAIGGWDIAYKSATGSSFGSVATIPAGKTIAPFSFFLLGGDQVVPTPDHVDTSLGFAAAGGHVALRNSSNAIIDKVGYGTANDPEGAAAPTPPENQSLERKPGAAQSVKGNGQDGDNNAADFDSRAVAEPQNSASARELPDSTAGTLIIPSAALYQEGETFTITVSDADLNNKTFVAETIQVKVTSLRDTIGILVTLNEAASDTNIFRGTVGVSASGTNAGANLIGVGPAGDTVTVTYTDKAPFQTRIGTVTYKGHFKIKIVEMMIDAPDTEPNKEWIEILNMSEREINIGGWKFQDSLDGATSTGDGVFTFPAGTILENGARIVLGATSDAAGGNVDIVYGDSDAGRIFFNNNGDEAVILDPNGKIHESVIYTAGWPYADNWTIERINNNGPSSDSTNWARTLVLGGTPGEISSHSPTVVINEIMFDPSGSEPANEWIEIYNPADAPVDLGGLRIEDNIASFLIPIGETIPAKGYYVLGYSSTAAGGQVDLVYGSSATNFQLSNTGDTVTLRRNSDSEIIDRVAYTSSWGGVEPKSLSRKFSEKLSQDISNWGKSKANGGTPRAANDVDTIPPVITHTPPARTAAGKDMGVHAVITDNIDKEVELGNTTLYYRSAGETTYSSVVMNRVAITDWNGIIPAFAVDTPILEYYIRAKDGSNNFGTFATADTPQQVTVVFIDTKLAINEIMYDPYDTEPANEWAEIRNYGNVAINLSGWKFGDGEDFFVIPNGTSIGAGNYLLFKRSAGAANGAPGIVYGDSSVGIQFDNIIGEITDQVIIKDPSGLIVDEVNYSAEQGAQNLSIDPKNTTLERFDPATGSNNRANWLHSYQPMGTPGAANGFKFIRNFDMSTKLINPAASDTVRFSFDLIVDTKTFVKIEIFSETGALLHTISLDTALDSGTYAYAYTWNGRNSSGSPLFGILMVEPVAINARNEVSRLRVNDKTAYLPNADIVPGGDYRAYTRTYFGYTLTKPMFVTYLFRKLVSGFEGPNTRFVWNDVPMPSGRIYVPWDGRDDTGIIVPYNPLPLISARPILGNVVISRQPMEILGLEMIPTTSFNPDSESQALRFDVTDSANITVRVRRAANGVLVRTVTSLSYKSSGLVTILWDGRDDLGAIVGDGLYVVEVYAESPVGRQQSTEFGEVYVRRSF